MSGEVILSGSKLVFCGPFGICPGVAMLSLAMLASWQEKVAIERAGHGEVIAE